MRSAVILATLTAFALSACGSSDAPAADPRKSDRCVEAKKAFKNSAPAIDKATSAVKAYDSDWTPDQPFGYEVPANVSNGYVSALKFAAQIVVDNKVCFPVDTVAGSARLLDN